MKKLTPVHKDFLKIILKYEKSILSSLVTDNAVVGFDIKDDGDVIVYFNDSPRWVQRLFNSYKRITLVEIAIRAVKIIYNNLNDKTCWMDKDYLQFLLEVINKAALEQDLPVVVDIILDTARLTDGTLLSSAYINQSLSQKRKRQNSENKDSLDGANLFATVQLRPGKTMNLFLGKIKE